MEGRNSLRIDRGSGPANWPQLHGGRTRGGSSISDSAPNPARTAPESGDTEGAVSIGSARTGHQQRGGAISPLGRRCPAFVSGGTGRLRQRVRRPRAILTRSRVCCRRSSRRRGLWTTLSSSPSCFSSSVSAGQADSSSSTTSPPGRHTPTAATLNNTIRASSQQNAVRLRVVRSESSFAIGSTRPLQIVASHLR